MVLIKNYLTHKGLQHLGWPSTVGKKTQSESGLEIRVNFMAKLEGCMSLNTRGGPFTTQEQRDLLTDCNDYKDQNMSQEP